MSHLGRATVIGIVGPSGAGKTTLLEDLIPALVGRGLAVAAVKHASHGFLADRPGKDSYRLYESGAEAVGLISNDQLVSFVRRNGPDRRQPCLAEALAALPDGLDVILAEGFSWETIPRVVLVPGSQAPVRTHLTRGPLLGIVRVPDGPPAERPVFATELVDALAREIASRVPGRCEESRPAEPAQAVGEEASGVP